MSLHTHWLTADSMSSSRWPQLFEAQNVLIPSYLADNCSRLGSNDMCRLHSTIFLRCVVLQTKTELCDRSLAATGPQIWNLLPASPRAVDWTFQETTRDICLIEATMHSDVLILGTMYKFTYFYYACASVQGMWFDTVAKGSDALHLGR